MSFASACESWEAAQKVQVMAATWGHLYPPLATEHAGSFEFAIGTYSQSEGQPLSINFGMLPDSPILHDDVSEFIFRQCFNAGAWSKQTRQPGVYRWTGTYRKCKNAVPQFIRGKLELRYAFNS